MFKGMKGMLRLPKTQSRPRSINFSLWSEKLCAISRRLFPKKWPQFWSMNVNDILPSSGCLSDRCLIALFLMSVWQAMSDDDVEETEFLDNAEALFGSRFLGGSNHCPTIPGQHSKALKDPHDPYKSVCSKSAVKVLTQVSCIDYDILDHNGMLVHAQ